MPTDWLFYWLTQPMGLLVIGLAVAIPFVIWRVVLGKAYAHVGFSALIAGYACAMAGLVVFSFMSAYVDFSSRVAEGILQEAQRGSLVARWSVSMVVISLVFVLPLVGLLGVPLAAVLLKRRRLNYTTIAVAAALLWVSLAGLLWAVPSNEWHRMHRLESLMMWLEDLLPAVLLIAMPFLLGIFWVSRPYREAP